MKEMNENELLQRAAEMAAPPLPVSLHPVPPVGDREAEGGVGGHLAGAYRRLGHGLSPP